MKTTFKLFGTQSGILCAISLLALIVLSMAACDSGFGSSGGTDPLLNGTWVNEEIKRDRDWDWSFTFNNGSVERFTNAPHYKGTYNTNGNSITITVTHYHGQYVDGGDGVLIIPDKWYSRADLKALGFSEDVLTKAFWTETWSYSISGTTLYIGGEYGTYIKR